MDVFRESSDESVDEAPSVIVMLDGLNEVTVERTALLVEIREIIEHWKGVQILISSRPDMRDTMGWSDFHILELVWLEKIQIDKYLEEWDLSPLVKEGDDNEYPLSQLLQNPMMLTIYVASCETLKEYGNTSLYEFKAQVETPGEHYCKPYFEEGKGWRMKSNDSTLLAEALSKCRGHFNSNYAYAVANILGSWKLMRD